jgi:hypothetical protein
VAPSEYAGIGLAVSCLPLAVAPLATRGSLSLANLLFVGPRLLDRQPLHTENTNELG